MYFDGKKMTNVFSTSFAPILVLCFLCRRFVCYVIPLSVWCETPPQLLLIPKPMCVIHDVIPFTVCMLIILILLEAIPALKKILPLLLPQWECVYATRRYVDLPKYLASRNMSVICTLWRRNQITYEIWNSLHGEIIINGLPLWMNVHHNNKLLPCTI